MLEPQPSQERRRWCLFRCRRPPTDEDIFGKKWVTLTDPAGSRCVPRSRRPHTEQSQWNQELQRPRQICALLISCRSMCVDLTRMCQ